MPVERVKAWQCIGCGRIEGAQPCIGICEDRPQHFVYAEDYERLEAVVRHSPPSPLATATVASAA